MGTYGKFQSDGACVLLHHVDAAGSQGGCGEVKFFSYLFSYRPRTTRTRDKVNDVNAVLQDSIPATVTAVSGGVGPGEAVRNRPHPCRGVKLREVGSELTSTTRWSGLQDKTRGRCLDSFFNGGSDSSQSLAAEG